MTRRWVFGITLVLLGGLTAGGAFLTWLYRQPPAVPQLAGEYRIEGQSARGVYRGTALIFQKDRAVFVQWASEAGERLQGYGLIVGHTVVAAYANEDAGVGVFYRIEGQRLVGQWPERDGTIQTETLTRTSQADP